MIAVGASFVVYAALSHAAYLNPHAKGLGAVLSVAPIMLIGLLLVWRWIHALAAVLLAIVLCASLSRYWQVFERHYSWLDLAQQCGLYGLVAVAFARSLFRHRVPLCTQLSMQLNSSLAPAEITYLRRATVAWAVFYALMAVTILILYFLAPLRVWSLFVNFVTIGLIIVAGIIDLAIRYRVLPRRPGDGILAIIRRSLTG